jgi:uncharacterized membrane protein
MAIDVYLLALLVGIFAGFRTMAAPAAVSWAARIGALDLQGTSLAFLGHALTPWIFTAFALGELVVDQLPSTPSRKAAAPFVGRVASGGLCGAALGISAGSAGVGLLLGVFGAALGTLGGYELRRRLAAKFRKDRPAALLEDALTITGLLFVVLALTSLG